MGAEATGEQTADPHEYRVLASEEVFTGRVISLRRDTVAMPGGGDSVREVVEHPGAVGIVALDDQDRVVMLQQYRHAVGERMWEVPAGLRDADGEPPADTARRELAEEVGLAAERWSLLTSHYPSPGFCDELVQVYLAEGLSEIGRPADFVVEHEELDMTVEWVPLADAVQWVFDGTVRNSLAIVGLLAAAQHRATGVRLRPADAG